MMGMASNPARGRFSDSEAGGRVQRGVNPALEAAADAILKKYRQGVPKYSDQQDFFSENQWRSRLRREVFTNSGTPEKSIVSGIFKRSYVPPRRKGPRETDKGGDE